ncbi:unnamed protein product [Gongylonema pulchrum]|uniref:Uncharacterized protein n=1 Tax=Gongylonema pulchrum TaxID=637853 RepID=A0A3P7RAX9_9BILA|nr:unnamed protein product [Gongylonema pulchrum]
MQKCDSDTKQFQMELFLTAVIEFFCNSEHDQLRNFLCCFFSVMLQENDRVGLKQMAVRGHFIRPSLLSVEQEALRRAFGRRILQMFSGPSNLNIDKRLTVNEPAKSDFPISSRYETDFKEIKMIGKGGFGQVFHVICTELMIL